MVRETRIDQASLIYPMFVRDGEGIREEIPSMAGQYRYSVDRMYEELEKLSDAGVGRKGKSGLCRRRRDPESALGGEKKISRSLLYYGRLPL